MQPPNDSCPTAATGPERGRRAHPNMPMHIRFTRDNQEIIYITCSPVHIAFAVGGVAGKGIGACPAPCRVHAGRARRLCSDAAPPLFPAPPKRLGCDPMA